MTESSQDNFTARSFILFTIDDDKNAGCELHWGNSNKDIEVFGLLLQAITSGELNDSIKSLLEEKAKENRNNKKAVKIIYKNFKDTSLDEEPVVDPLNVEIFR